MYIFIMRHGEAQPPQSSDKDRALTLLGLKQSEQTAAWLLSFAHQHNIKIDKALVSPFVRAQQTFERLNKTLDVAYFSTNPDITPSGNTQNVHRYIDLLLAEHQNCEGLLLVSHMPLVSYLVDELCAQYHSTLFATGAVVCVDYKPSECLGRLDTVYNPD